MEIEDANFIQSKVEGSTLHSHFLAGAEGVEPSSRYFGDSIAHPQNMRT